MGEMFKKIPLFKKAIVIFVAVLFNLSLILPVPPEALAGDARLYLSPSAGTRYVGSSFAVSVLVNSGSHTTNAYKAVVRFPTALLSVTSVSVSGSICTLQITGSPSYSNSAGSVNFECGHTGSFSGSAGRIGTITFNARAAGTAILSFTNAQIKAADGAGTEVLGSTGGATFSLRPAPIGSPTVTSSTHPNQNSWYSTRSVSLSWTKPSGSGGFSYTFNESKTTIPDDVSEGKATSATFSARSDGIYYFHIKAHGEAGWGTTTHFRIQADTTPPDPFLIYTDPSADHIDKAPLVWATATDGTSGIGHYELSLDGANFTKVKIPYQFSSIPEGNHSLFLRAFDRAGNYRESNVILRVINIEDPIIIEPADGAYVPLLENLHVRGTSPRGTLQVYLDGEALDRFESDGNFDFVIERFLKPGKHTLRVVAINENGIESSPAISNFTVDPRAISLFGRIFPGWFVYSFLLGLLILLLILLLIYRRKQKKFDEHVVEDVEEIKSKVEKTLDRAEEDIDKAVEEVLESGDPARLSTMERELEHRIKQTEGQVRRELEGKLDKVKAHHQKRFLPINLTDQIKQMVESWRQRKVKKPKKVR